MYAIIKTGGKQYKVKEGDILVIDKLNKEPKEKVEFEAIAKNNGQSLEFGKFSVEAEVIHEGRERKIIIFKKRRRKDSKLKRGFRRSYTRVKILKIKN